MNGERIPGLRAYITKKMEEAADDTLAAAKQSEKSWTASGAYFALRDVLKFMDHNAEKYDDSSTEKK